jgi:uncharacterized protein YdaU (DUF1376 family)
VPLCRAGRQRPGGFGLNYYERHIGDYLKNTAHLSLLEHGIYTRLLDVYYTREDGIPVDQVERLVGARSKDERTALGEVLDEFFIVDDGVLRQARCDREIERFKDKQRKAKASADARWSNTERNANASPNAMRTHSEGNALQSPVTSNQTPVTKKSRETARGSRLPTDFNPDFDFAVEQGIANTPEEASKFVDYWNAQPGQKGVKADWQATWRNWCRNAKKPQQGGTGASETAYQRAKREQMERDFPNITKKPTLEVVNGAAAYLGR